MDRKTANLDLQMEGNRVKFSQFHASAGHSFQLSNQPLPHPRLEGIGSCVPCECAEKDNTGRRCDQQILAKPAPARLGAGFIHRNWAPEPARASVRISLPERKSCSHAINISLIFFCVRTSLIFGLTSASGTVAPPDWR